MERVRQDLKFGVQSITLQDLKFGVQSITLQDLKFGVQSITRQFLTPLNQHCDAFKSNNKMPLKFWGLSAVEHLLGGGENEDALRGGFGAPVGEVVLNTDHEKIYGVGGYRIGGGAHQLFGGGVYMIRSPKCYARIVEPIFGGENVGGLGGFGVPVGEKGFHAYCEKLYGVGGYFIRCGGLLLFGGGVYLARSPRGDFSADGDGGYVLTRTRIVVGGGRAVGMAGVNARGGYPLTRTRVFWRTVGGATVDVVDWGLAAYEVVAWDAEQEYDDVDWDAGGNAAGMAGGNAAGMAGGNAAGMAGVNVWGNAVNVPDAEPNENEAIIAFLTAWMGFMEELLSDARADSLAQIVWRRKMLVAAARREKLIIGLLAGTVLLCAFSAWK